MKNNILLFSADPGGAECLIPVAKALRGSFDLTFMCKGTAVKTFERHFAKLLIADGSAFKDMEVKLEKFKVDLILTSASSLPEKDMTEKLLWRWAANKGIHSIAVLDQWENYSRRFSGIGEDERMAYLPDKIAIMDGLARDEMIKEGFPGDRLQVTGHSALESFEETINKIRSGTIVNRFKRNEGELYFTFFSQPIRSFYADSLGYDEGMAFNDIVSLIPRLEDRLNHRINLACKLHPKNIPEDLILKSSRRSEKLVFIRDEYSNAELVLSSDIVIGMNSVMLIHSILAGTPTISYEPARRSSLNSCMAVKIGAIPAVMDNRELESLIVKLKTDENFFQAYLIKQKLCATHRGAIDKIVMLVRKMSNRDRIFYKRNGVFK